MIKKNYIYIAIAVIALITIIGLIYYIYPGFGEIEITVVPNDTTYTLNSKNYEGSKVIKTRAGEYSITFKRNLFEEKTEEIKVTKNQKQKYEIILDISGDVSNNFDNLSDTDKEAINAYQQQIASLSSKNLVEKTPIVTLLPYTDDNYYFRVDYAFYNKADPNDLTFEITIFTEALQEKTESEIKSLALKWLKDNGGSTDNSKIKWYSGSENDFN